MGKKLVEGTHLTIGPKKTEDSSDIQNMSLQTINVQKSLIRKKVLFSGNKMASLFYNVFENVCVIFMPERLEKKPYNVISVTSV